MEVLNGNIKKMIKEDKITQERIQKLHPKIRDEVKKIIEEANSLLADNVEIRVVQGLRTIEEQNALYAQGRTKPGPKVTNAKGGSSFHNYGICLDFCLLINDKEISWSLTNDLDKDKKADWFEVINIFKKYGWSAGADWKSFKDNPHVEKTFGYTWQQLLAKYNKKDFIAGTSYVKI